MYWKMVFGKVKAFAKAAFLNLKNGNNWIKQIKKAFERGYKGESVIDGVKKGFESASSAAKRILRTQCTFAENYARQTAAEDHQRDTGELLDKTWICTFYNSRDSHVYLHNMKIPIEDDFPSYGGPMKYPGDGSRVGPEEICNCRCYIVISKR